jgi:dipeptidyl aminopeptidase/acylaminoacyl peptidase
MTTLFTLVRPAFAAALLATFAVSTSPAQQTTPPRSVTPGSGDRPPRRPVKINQARAESLYVSTDPEDHPPRDFERDIATKAKTDSSYAARSRSVMEFSKVKYRSRAGDMDVPAYLFTPLAKRGARGHAAMVWVHGGVHGDWNEAMLPFVKEAVQRGYVIITPDYRGSNGYGAAHYNAIDYGGKELDDVMAAYDYLKTLPYVDPERLVVFGGSYGGFMTLIAATKKPDLWRAAVAWVGISDLHRLYEKSMEHFKYYFREQMGDPETDRALWRDRSAIEFAERLRAKLLMVHGVNDPRCPVDQSRIFRDRLLELGRREGEDFEYVELGDEGHGSTDIAQKIRTFNILAEYLERVL